MENKGFDSAIKTALHQEAKKHKMSIDAKNNAFAEIMKQVKEEKSSK